MTKRISALFFTLIMLLTLTISVNAAIPDKLRFIDECEMVSASSASSLEEKLDRISEKYECDVAVFVTYDYNPEIHGSIENFATEIYQYYGYGNGQNNDGIILVVDCDDRKYDVYRNGKCQDIFNETDELESLLAEGMTSGDLTEALTFFANTCENDLAGTPIFVPILVGIGVGIVIGLIVILIFKAQLKSVRFNSSAGNYVKDGSFTLNQNSDIYLYSHVTRTARPKSDSSSGGSSSSGSSGGSNHSSGSF